MRSRKENMKRARQEAEANYTNYTNDDEPEPQQGPNPEPKQEQQQEKNNEKQQQQQQQGQQQQQNQQWHNPPPKTPDPEPVQKSWYEVLGIDPNSTFPEAKAAYKSLIKKYHPDLVANLGEEIKELAEQRLKEVNGAFDQAKKRLK